MTSVFNILASYRYITQNDPSFKAMLHGFYRIIAGRHDDPLDIVEPGNHIGLYDVLTLGIPWLIEAFLRANWIGWDLLRSTVRFLTHQIMGLLILVRAIFSGILTLLAMPLLALIYFLRRLN